MKRILAVFVACMVFWSCEDSDPSEFTGREQTFELHKSSDYDFTGTLLIRELIDKSLEFNLKLDGAKSSTDYFYPAHLHFGGYDQAGAPMAYMLNAVSAKTLESRTKVSKLSDGSTLSFESLKVFDGHVKVHLAAEGPDYQVILVAGNVGGSLAEFDAQKMATCEKSF